MRNPWHFLSLLLTAFTVVSCGGGGSGDDPPTVDADLKALVRVLHASPDTPSANVFINNDQVLGDVPYKTGSGFLEFDPGTYDIRMEGILPTGTTPIINVARSLLGFQEYNLIALGNNASIDALVVENPVASLAAGMARLQVVHAAPDAPAVDVYVTTPGADLSASEPVGNAAIAFSGFSQPQEVTAGDYQIRVTAAGNPASVVFDSGTITVTADEDLLFTAVENTGPGTALISLVKLDGETSEEILDQNTPANVRVIHALPNTAPVNVVANNNATTTTTTLAGNLAFANVTDFTSITPGQYSIQVSDAANPGFSINADTPLAAGTTYSVYALGPLADPRLLVLEDDLRSIATEARLRLVHASPTAGNVDIYITPLGTDIDIVDPDFTNVAFAADTDYVPLAGGAYNVTVTPTGSKIPAIGPTPINLVNGGVYTAAARDAAGSGAPFGLILMDDFL